MIDMNSFRVIFKGKNELDSSLSLTFKGINNSPDIKVPSKVIIDLKKLATSQEKIGAIQNIEQVLQKSDFGTAVKFYYIIIFAKKDNPSKRGYLIGNIKEKGDVLLGVWPFNAKTGELDQSKFNEEIYSLIQEPHLYENILIVN